MSEILFNLREWAELLVGSLGYGGIVVVMMAVAPEFVMPLAGLLVAEGRLEPLGVLAAGTAGAVAGQAMIYGVARGVGEVRVRAFLRGYGRWILLSEGDMDRALGLFERYDLWLLVVGRFLPTVRSLVSLPAGLEPMSLRTFLLLTALGTLLWNSVLMGLGILLAENRQRVAAFLGAYETGVGLLVGLALALFLAKRLRSVLLARRAPE